MRREKEERGSGWGPCQWSLHQVRQRTRNAQDWKDSWMGFTGPALFEMHGGHPDRSVSQKLGGEIEAVVRTK